MNGEHAERHRRKLYGRRKGPKLSAHKSQLFETLLPKLALDIRSGADPRSYFSPPPRGEVENSQAERRGFSGGGMELDEGPPPGSLRSPTSPQGGGEIGDAWLEIGFGAGEHLLWQAQNNPHVGLIGAEPYESGVAKLLSRLDSFSPFEREKGRDGGVSPPIQTPDDVAPPPHLNPLPRWGRGNLRIHMGDARDVLEALPDASLGRVFILFPDPWPKARHAKRRFIQMEMLDRMARVMKPGAELRFASDDAPLVEYTLERLMAHPAFEWAATRAADWQSRTADWPPTRYEAKQLHGVPVFLRFYRT